MSGARRTVTYWDYLRLERLLSCQAPPDAAAEEPGTPRALLHHDELLFILVHQVYELWFRQILHELRRARDLLARPRVPEEDIPEISAHLDRINEIIRLGVEQFRVMETMPPVHFLAFRDRLIPASGFQSLQFRLIEIGSGLRDEDRLSFEGKRVDDRFAPEARAAMAAARAEPTLRDALFDWLARAPIEIAFPGFVEAFLAAYDQYLEEQARLQLANPYLPEEAAPAILARLEGERSSCRAFLAPGDERTGRAHAAFLFLTSYRAEPLLRWPYALLERLVEYEEYLRLFRFRHARMVERMIGLRLGTGGSPGVDYLDETARRYRIFGALLHGRSYLLARDRLPDLPNPDPLRFRFS